ncbi:type III secretion system chaperone [Halodesulfovibrio sp.]|uniref:type III secretion system chaperone n=1 Tax=Halodesulfovibrio sp. TaxID=1912772 RepID=UPI0025C6896A|nr:type III secretion system chaperone [Halodesulfovibrio sp.]
MKTTHTLQDVLVRFGKTVDQQPLTIQNEGYSTLTVCDKVTVRLVFDDSNGIIQLISPISPDNPEIYADLLELNMFREQLAGARFILLRESGKLALQKHIVINNTTVHEFEVLFEEFISIALKWYETFSDQNKLSEEESDSVSTLVMDDIFNRA